MERLTERELYDGKVCYTKCAATNCPDKCSMCSIPEKAAAKLKEYEDAEENGLLLRLPVKVGTPVYYVQKCICPYSCLKCGAFRLYGNCYCEYKARIFKQEFGYRHLHAFGKTVFLTKEEAEAALEKMKGEER